MNRFTSLADRMMGLDRAAASETEWWQNMRGAGVELDDYAAFVFRWGEAFYDNRVRKAGFAGGLRALDAGCGYGQWTTALARNNGHVVAVDRRLEMVRAARELCRQSGLRNVSFFQGSLSELGLAPDSFDFIWCSLVLEYVDRSRVMALFSKLLRTGGRLYVSTNARGRWLVKSVAGLLRNNWNLVRVSTRTALCGTRAGVIPSRLELADVAAHVAAHGMRLVALGSEGYVHLGDGPPKPMPMFPTHFLGKLEQNIEFVCEKSAVE